MKYGAGLMLMLSTAMWCGAADNSPEKHIRESAAVLSEIMNAKDNGIPEDLLQKAYCVGVIPNLKRAGFIVGAKYGKGIVTCRNGNGWSAPEIARIEGGSIGLQIGAGETDVVFIVMNERGMEKLMRDKFTLGGDASVMAGPVGRSAQAATDAEMHADILAYSRSRGIFAGISLEGATLRPDNDDDRALYGSNVTPQDILHGRVMPPAAGEQLYAELNRYPSKNTARSR
jgi:lipid-binding SYLF domain-containing protein